jgi:hypothetical protein
MAEVIDYESTLPEAGLPGDLRDLNVVRLGLRVWGWVMLALFAPLLGLSLCLLPMNGLADEPGHSGLRMVLRTMAVAAPGCLAGWLLLYSGRCIRRRERRRFSVAFAICFVVVGALVLAAAARRPTRARLMRAALAGGGLVVSLLTWRVLGRESVKGLYAAAGARRTSPAAGALPLMPS